MFYESTAGADRDQEIEDHETGTDPGQGLIGDLDHALMIR